ncbi:MAG: malate synthase, partial [Pseudomonadota bacterium]
MSRTQVSGLSVATVLHDFLVKEALPGTGVTPEAFFTGLAGLIRDLAPKNAALLAHRDGLQAKIDAW